MVYRQIPADLADYPFDVIVIGAGVNGAGIARDATMRGLKVLLLDKGDISDGTSSWSSRLAHGGLRYLEHGEIGLVRESLRERERLLHNAPHLVRPMSMIVPLFDSNKRSASTIRLGMIAYDVLSFDKSLANHRMLDREQALQRVPGLKAEGINGAAIYYDAQVEYAERLCVENALSAQQQGAMVLTYAQVDKLLVENNTVVGVEFADLLQDGRHTAKAPVVVNVAGPWVDQVLAGLGRPVKRMIGGTKGTHIIVDAFPGAPHNASMYFEARNDHRPILIMPWNGKYLIGTTDMRYDGDLDYVTGQDDELDYLLAETNYVIPEANLTRESILFTYSGVRPLPYQKKGSTGSITRRHIIYDHAPQFQGLISIIGGKLTTYRSLAEQTVDKVFKKLHKKASKSSTGRSPLPGASIDLPGFKAHLQKKYGDMPDASLDHLVRVYGSRAWDILELAGNDPVLRATFSRETGAIGAEVIFALQYEMAQTLSDVLLRRTMVGLDTEVGLDADVAAAKIAQTYLGWSDQRVAEEIATYRAFIQRYHPRSMDQIASTQKQPLSRPTTRAQNER